MTQIAVIKKVILELFDNGAVDGWLDYVLIMEKTDFHLEDIIKACEELEAEGKIGGQEVEEDISE